MGRLFWNIPSSTGPNIPSTFISKRWGRAVRVREREVMIEAEVRVKQLLTFNMEKGTQTKERRWLTEVGKGRESPLEPPEGRQPCQHLHFSPVRPRLNFWPQELLHNNLYCFKSQSLWYFYYSSNRILILYVWKYIGTGKYI